MEVLVFIDFLNHHDLAVGRSHHHVLRVAGEEADGAAEEIDGDGKEADRDSRINIKRPKVAVLQQEIERSVGDQQGYEAVPQNGVALSVEADFL